MWRLKISEVNENENEEEGWVKSVNNHIGRQYWEFDPNIGTPQERAQVDMARHEFHKNRFQAKQSSDLLLRLQVIPSYISYHDHRNYLIINDNIYDIIAIVID